MKKYLKYCLLLLAFVTCSCKLAAQQKEKDVLEDSFLNPPQSAKPWVFWYLLHGAVSKEGITADLEAMKQVGIGGAYLMPIKDTNSKIPFQPQARQLTPEWWALVKFALQEAKRLQLQIGVHVSDGFALAGGPWIKPEMSMQKLVWTKTFIKAGSKSTIMLPQPQANQNFYKDIAVYAYPANYNNDIAVKDLKPVVTTSNNTDAFFLPDANAKQTFRSDSNCWIQYYYPQAVTVRQVKIKKQNNAYQSQRFIIQQSNDGINFTAVDTMQPPRHGWQDWDEAYTYALKNFTSKYIRFVWQKEGTEPGSEDLDAAKWKPALRVQGIYISDEPVINNYEAKNGSVWRVAANTTNEEVSNTLAVPRNKIIDLTKKLSANGKLNWQPPAKENWVIVRIGHTSTGAVNSTAGGGKGLECDKFSTAATTLQFNNWFNKFYTQTDSVVAKEVIKVFHVDSWECGSQNWSSNFAAEFKQRRGYDLLPFLLVMTGTPVNDAASSEKIFHDVRQTIAELVNDKFYATLKELAHKKNCVFSAESIAPTFVSDGLLHYKHADIPMGEFWVNSPTHDKPNDMLDAISGAHIYGKNIVQAEAFTTLRSDWSEHPGSIKTIGDRAFAAGINKFALHVFMHSPWLDKKPGMTLDGIGLFYQRDQTWFKQSKAWIDYLTRCQALLQLGKPIVDIAVFTGEEIPSRSILPDRLVNTLPGLFGKERVQSEAIRLINAGQPQRTMPAGVTHSANMADPENWVDALHGYSYDCFNPDVLMKMSVDNGRVVTAGGASYAVLVIPGKHPMNLNAIMSDAVQHKLQQLAKDGARIIIDEKYFNGFAAAPNIFKAPYTAANLKTIGVKPDLLIENNNGEIAWTHRRWKRSAEIFFLSNQTAKAVTKKVWFNNDHTELEIWNPVTGDIYGRSYDVKYNDDNTEAAVLKFEPGQSYFVVLRKEAAGSGVIIQVPIETKEIAWVKDWDIAFMENDKPVKTIQQLLPSSWSQSEDPFVKYFSGTAIYTNSFTLTAAQAANYMRIELPAVYNIATIKINGTDCGTLWTAPFYKYINKKLLRAGENHIEIAVTNTWRNRLIGDELMPAQKTTWLNSPYKMQDKGLLPAGLVGQVRVLVGK